MVIEYSGNVIRSVLTDRRERFYEGKVRERERNRSISFLHFCKIKVIFEVSRKKTLTFFNISKGPFVLFAFLPLTI